MFSLLLEARCRFSISRVSRAKPTYLLKQWQVLHPPLFFTDQTAMPTKLLSKYIVININLLIFGQDQHFPSDDIGNQLWTSEALLSLADNMHSSKVIQQYNSKHTYKNIMVQKACLKLGRPVSRDIEQKDWSIKFLAMSTKEWKLICSQNNLISRIKELQVLQKNRGTSRGKEPKIKKKQA